MSKAVSRLVTSTVQFAERLLDGVRRPTSRRLDRLTLWLVKVESRFDPSVRRWADETRAHAVALKAAAAAQPDPMQIIERHRRDQLDAS